MENIRKLNDIVETFYSKLQKYIFDLLEKEKPDIVGLSVYTGTLGPSLFTFKNIKKRFPEVLTIMGGGIFADHLNVNTPNFKLFMESTPFIDKVIVGEGETLFTQLLLTQEKYKNKVLTLEDINYNLLNITEVDIPDFTDFNMKNYPYISHYASRSCPFQCSFCSETVQWGKYRKKSPKQVVRELVVLYKKHSYQLFLLSDSLLNPIISDVSNEFMNTDSSIYWDGYLRADAVACNIDNTFLWRKAGFYRARLGVESGSNRILKLMDKKITTEDIRVSVTNLALAGIKTTTYWIIGYPGETEEDFQQTLDLITELKDDIYEAECNPFNYFFTGQVSSDLWQKTYKAHMLYSEEDTNILMAQTWVMDTYPDREEIHSRICRFVKHCRCLGLPNPYSEQEIYLADERWKRLHINAVPTMAEFKSSSYINENKTFNNQFFSKVIEETGEFSW